MAIKITEVKEHQPWDVYLSTLEENADPDDEIRARSLLAGYHKFLDDYVKTDKVCLACGHKFRPRKKKESE